jgi:hypothetical protein
MDKGSYEQSEQFIYLLTCNAHAQIRMPTGTGENIIRISAYMNALVLTLQSINYSSSICYRPPHFALTWQSYKQITMAARYKSYCPRLLERWDRGFESNSMHGCLYSVSFILCLCCPVCR